MFFKYRFFRILFLLFIIYVAWSFFIDIINLRENINTEALVPCFLYFPPIGFLAVGLILFKMVESTTAMYFLKKFITRIKDKRSRHATPGSGQ